MKKVLLTIATICLFQLVNAQSDADTNLLLLKDSIHFYELNYFSNGKSILYQSIKYDVKSKLHEEYWY